MFDCPQDADEYRRRGVAWLQVGGYERKSPFVSAARQKCFDLAIANLTTAIQLDPKDADAFKWRSTAYEVKGELRKAAADRVRAEQLVPDVDGQAGDKHGTSQKREDTCNPHVRTSDYRQKGQVPSMTDIDELGKKIEAELATANERIDQLQKDGRQTYEELGHRHARFTAISRRLVDESKYALEKLASYFDNAELSRSEDRRGFHFTCSFKHTPKFPASVKLRFDITHDDEVRKIILVYNLEILPVFLKFERTDQIAFDMNAVDEPRLWEWVRDKIVSCVQTYMRIPFVDQYQQGNLVTDPVAKVRFSKNFAKAEAEYQGHTFFFICDETHREFTAHPGRFVGM